MSKVTPKLGCTVLVCVDDPSAERSELSGDNLEEVLEHVGVRRGLKSDGSMEGAVISDRETYRPFGVVQWMIDDPHLSPQGFGHDGFAFVVLIIRGELQFMD